MRLLLASLIVASACGGPGQGALARTPTATTRRTPNLAPAANNSDEERERMVKSNDEMTDAQNAHREAQQAPETAPKPASSSPPGGLKPKTAPVSPDKP